MNCRNKNVGKKMFLIIGGGISFIGAFLHFYYKLELTFDSMILLGNQLYTAPHARIFSYIVGTFTAWLLHEKCGKLLLTKVSK